MGSCECAHRDQKKQNSSCTIPVRFICTSTAHGRQGGVLLEQHPPATSNIKPMFFRLTGRVARFRRHRSICLSSPSESRTSLVPHHISSLSPRGLVDRQGAAPAYPGSYHHLGRMRLRSDHVPLSSMAPDSTPRSYHLTTCTANNLISPCYVESWRTGSIPIGVSTSHPRH